MIDKTELEELIHVKNMSYKDIGKMYGLSDVTVRKHAYKQGIILPKRKNYDNKYCLNCGKQLNGPKKWANNKYCCQQCQKDHEYNQRIDSWKRGEDIGYNGKGKQLKLYIRRYILNKFNNCCEVCGFSDINPFSGLSILQVHHIDGDCTNNKEENLQLLCPNCHAKTENYCRLNNESKRKKKVIYKGM